MKLSPDRFAEFHEAVHGFAPFSWQQRLLEQVVEERTWPQVLDLPTGAGKTTCLDIALFALALNASEKVRWCPRRIAMVVDRRVVVDQVAERGRKLAMRLNEPQAASVIQEVARQLRSLTRDSEEPLGVFTLRGGMPKDDGWVRSPDQPLIIASTVDQLGSRLLMQGYGVSAGMRPVHAGLLANDTLLLLDEVHLSEPFAQTLQQLAALRTRFSDGLSTRFHTAFLSATPTSSGAKTFRLTKSELSADDLLGKRLAAPKRTTLRDANDRQSVEKACVDASVALLGAHRTIAVVLNRVNSAATVARQLTEQLGDEAEVVLLTGRMRPLDRDDVLRGLRDRISSGRQRVDDSKKLVVVATQCIEAGADFDFDALVTEAASLAALRQRFGRVDRLGEYGRAEGVIVRDKGAKDDPIYGDALAATWSWLQGKLGGAKKKKKGEDATIDFGVLALPSPEPEEAPTLLSPGKNAPVLLPAYLDLWSQTSPAPALVPDVALFLHGPESGPADVQVVWRADVSEELLHSAHEDAHELERLAAVVSAIRPSSLESLSLPFVAAKRWLAGAEVGAVADVEGGEVVWQREAVSEVRGLAFRWRGDDSEVITQTELRPGDTIVVPSVRGGLRQGCFDSASDSSVDDLAERAALFGRGKPLLRLDDAVLKGLELPAVAALLHKKERSSNEALDDALVQSAQSASLAQWKRVWLEQLVGATRIVLASEGRELLLGGLLAKRQLHALVLNPEQETIENGGDLTTDDEDSIFTGRSVPLLEHSTDVQTFAKEFAQRLSLPDELGKDLALAGWLHDIGKADRRFQVLLRAGDEVEFYKDETPWAKSGMQAGARAAQRRARQLSGYPRRARHEVQSLAMLMAPQNAAQVKANDLELVLHLVASHHGYCRPFAPAIEDMAPVQVELTNFNGWNFAATSSANELHQLDSAIPGRFWSLQRRLGWLELCWLEAVLRLADHRASEVEQQKREHGGRR